MVKCKECEARHEKHECEGNTPQVLQIENKPEAVLFHRVDVPASMGDDVANPPMQGQYRNILLVYEANNHAYLFNSDGLYTFITGPKGEPGTTIFDELLDRPRYNGVQMTSSTNIPDVDAAVEAEAELRAAADGSLATAILDETAARTASDTALGNALDTETAERQENVTELSDKIDAEETAREQAVTAISNDLEQEIADRTSGDTAINTAINKVVVTDFSLDATPSTTSIKLDGAKQNILTGATSSSSITLPVASSSQAGVMNTSTYNAIQSNANNINAILAGSVAVSGLPSSPSQSQLTTAWQTATGLSTLINGAKILDSTNEKIWTYYTNTTVWYESPAGGTVTISTATNSSLGIVQGDATTEGKVFVESNGTMSLNGWDQVVDDIADNMADIASLQSEKVDKVTGKGLSTEDFTTAEKNKLANLATVATTGDYDDLSNTPDVPVITMTTTDPGEDQPLSANNFIAVYEV